MLAIVTMVALAVGSEAVFLDLPDERMVAGSPTASGNEVSAAVNCRLNSVILGAEPGMCSMG